MKDVAPLHPVVVPGTEVAVRLPRREIEYRASLGYKLTVDGLPWGNEGYLVRRYRIDGEHNLDLVEEQYGTGKTFTMSSSLLSPAVELVEIEKK